MWPIVCCKRLLWQQQDFLAAAAEPGGIKRKFISAFVGSRGSARWLFAGPGYGTLATLLRPPSKQPHLDFLPPRPSLLPLFALSRFLRPLNLIYPPRPWLFFTHTDHPDFKSKIRWVLGGRGISESPSNCYELALLLVLGEETCEPFSSITSCQINRSDL